MRSAAPSVDAGALEDALRCRQQETRLKMKLLEDQLQVLMQLSEASQLSGSSGESQNQSTIGTNEEVMLTASFVNGHDGQDFPSPSAAAMFLQHQVQIDIHAVLPAQQVGARAVSAHGEETSLCASKQRPPVVTNESVASSSSSTVLECVSAPSVDAAVAGAKKKGCKLGNSNNTSLEALAALPQDDVEQDEEVAHIHDAALRMISVRKKARSREIAREFFFERVDDEVQNRRMAQNPEGRGEAGTHGDSARELDLSCVKKALKSVSTVIGTQESMSISVAEHKGHCSSLRDDMLSVLRGMHRARPEQEVQNLSAQTVEGALRGRERKGAVGEIDMPREGQSLAAADRDIRDESAHDIAGEGCVIDNLFKTLQKHKNAYQEICAEWKESEHLCEIKRTSSMGSLRRAASRLGTGPPGHVNELTSPPTEGECKPLSSRKLYFSSKAMRNSSTPSGSCSGTHDPHHCRPTHGATDAASLSSPPDTPSNVSQHLSPQSSRRRGQQAPGGEDSMSLSDTVPFPSSPDSVRGGGGREEEEEDTHFLRVARARIGLFPYNLVTEMHAILDMQNGFLEDQSAGGEGGLQDGSGTEMGGEVQAKTGNSEKDCSEASAAHTRFLARRNREGQGVDAGVEGKEEKMGVRRGGHGDGGGGGGGGGDELTRATHLIDTLLQV